MIIENIQYKIRKTELSGKTLLEVIKGRLGGKVLRWFVSRVTDKEIVIEATICHSEIFESNGYTPTEKIYPGKDVVLSLIPTGIGCDIGGYAGDAAPVTNLLASTVDYLITNPNAVNASNFINMDENIVYTEGFMIDLFAQGMVDLYLPHANKVGLIIEKCAPEEMDIIFNLLNTVRAIHGVNLTEYVVTDAPIGSRCMQNESGAFVGTIDNPAVLLEACRNLISRGVNAIAITTNVQDLPAENYAEHFAGLYPNPVGGVEAVISHLVTRTFNIPAAHAPLMNMKQMDLVETIVDARGAGEMISASGLASILIGLKKAPQISLDKGNRISNIVNINNLLAVVVPASSLGGIPVLSAQKEGIPVVAVKENKTILNVTASQLGLQNVIEVQNYAEAAGIVLALKRGIHLESISRPLQTIRPVTEEIKIFATS